MSSSWMDDDDHLQLCKSWCAVSEDTTVGTGQKAKTFWGATQINRRGSRNELHEHWKQSGHQLSMMSVSLLDLTHKSKIFRNLV